MPSPRSIATRRELALQLMRAGVTAARAAARAGISRETARRARRETGIANPRGHCSACGAAGHEAVGGICSPSYRGAVLVLDRGINMSAAAREVGVSRRSVDLAVRRLRATRLRAAVRQETT